MPTWYIPFPTIFVLQRSLRIKPSCFTYCVHAMSGLFIRERKKTAFLIEWMLFNIKAYIKQFTCTILVTISLLYLLLLKQIQVHVMVANDSSRKNQFYKCTCTLIRNVYTYIHVRSTWRSRLWTAVILLVFKLAFLSTFIFPLYFLLYRAVRSLLSVLSSLHSLLIQMAAINI